MTEKMFNTRFKLRYDTASNWANIESTFKPLAGEVCIYEVKAALTNSQGVVVEPPVTLMKVGDGTSTLQELNYLYAKAADVYAWAKKQQIDIETVGNGNVISKVEWDAEKGGLKYTTASVATSEGMAAIQKDIADNRAAWAKDTTYTFAKNGKTLTITPNDGSVIDPIAFEYLTPDEVENIVTLKSITGKDAIKVETTNKAAVAELVIDSNAGNVVLTQSTNGLKASIDLGEYAKTADVPAIKVNNAGHADTAGNAATADKVNHALTIGGKTFDGSEAVDVTASDLGISGAMHFIGTSTTDPDTGSITIPGKENYTPALGDVVLYNDKEFVYSSNGWEELGDESSHALKTVKIEAGTDLVGGGTLEADRTISHATIARNDETDAAEIATHEGTITVVSSIATSETGHVTGVNTKTITLPEDKDTTYSWGFEDDNYTLKFTPSEGDATSILLIASQTASIYGTEEKDAIKVDVHTDSDAGITTTSGGIGLKLKENGGLKVDSEGLRISEDILFVFDGGSATLRTGESSTGTNPV